MSASQSQKEMLAPLFVVQFWMKRPVEKLPRVEIKMELHSTVQVLLQHVKELTLCNSKLATKTSKDQSAVTTPN